MQTTNFGLEELLRRAREKNLRIPRFQRAFVWKESQVKLLIDSMSRSYPIGSLLFLDKTPNLEISSRSIDATIKEESDIENDRTSSEEGESYILDGQQRATSIARVFLNAHPKKQYYFDLKLMLEEHGKEETSWIKSRQRGKRDPDRKDKGRLLRADVILEQQKADVYLSEYIEDSGDFPQFANDRRKGREAVAHVKGIFESIRNYKIPVVTLERNSGVESVCRVFETINSTGTRLTTFDLAVARFYPNPDLRTMWEKTLGDHKILSDFDVDGEEVLQVLYLSLAAQVGTYPEPTRGNLLSLQGHEVKAGWEKSASSLAQTYGWAKSQGARPRTLPSHNVLVAMAAIRNLSQGESDGEIWENHDLIRRWYFSKIMQAGASQASNYRIGLDFAALRQYVEDQKALQIQEVKLDVKILMKMRPSDVRYKALQNMFVTAIRHDLVSGGMIDSESALHDHHIFPRNAMKTHSLPRDMLDSICNRVPILGKSNQSLGEAYPQDYFGKMKRDAAGQGTLSGLAERLKDCMIPGDPRESSWPELFSVDKFPEFCRSRADIIIGRVRQIVGNSLRELPSDEDSSEYDE